MSKTKLFDIDKEAREHYPRPKVESDPPTNYKAEYKVVKCHGVGFKINQISGAKTNSTIFRSRF